VATRPWARSLRGWCCEHAVRRGERPAFLEVGASALAGHRRSASPRYAPPPDKRPGGRPCRHCATSPPALDRAPAVAMKGYCAAGGWERGLGSRRRAPQQRVSATPRRCAVGDAEPFVTVICWEAVGGSETGPAAAADPSTDSCSVRRGPTGARPCAWSTWADARGLFASLGSCDVRGFKAGGIPASGIPHGSPGRNRPATRE